MPESQKAALVSLITEALNTLGVSDVKVVLERPKSPEHGDIACTVAMHLARVLKKNPREIAGQIVAALKTNPDFEALIKSIDIAGPGFINMRFQDSARQDIIRQILTAGSAFGHNDSHKNESVLLEFVSANPTGPLHLGHARQGGFRTMCWGKYSLVDAGMESYSRVLLPTTPVFKSVTSRNLSNFALASFWEKIFSYPIMRTMENMLSPLLRIILIKSLFTHMTALLLNPRAI
ncbi:arginyL-tRNA synthetase [gut metagenome]|uniref:ArginyL-tRNA synthetase n=1 Tax=gut metagenome TaxID=749906 RepID=J9CJZ3_9ZZZZ